MRITLRRALIGSAGIAVTLAASAAAALVITGLPRIAAGMAAKAVCSAVFVAGRSPDGLLDQDVRPADRLLLPVRVSIDRQQRSVTGHYLGAAARRAVWLPDRGCVLDVAPAAAGSAVRAPAEDASATWPEGNAPLDRAQWGQGVDATRLLRAVDGAFAGAGDVHAANTRGIAVAHRGRLLVLRHAAGFGPGTALHGWSMTKTVAGMLMFKLASETGLALDAPVADAFRPTRAPAWVAAWRTDGRRAVPRVGPDVHARRIGNRGKLQPVGNRSADAVGRG